MTSTYCWPPMHGVRGDGIRVWDISEEGASPPIGRSTNIVADINIVVLPSPERLSNVRPQTRLLKRRNIRTELEGPGFGKDWTVL